jgi:hypothetical protein
VPVPGTLHKARTARARATHVIFRTILVHVGRQCVIDVCSWSGLTGVASLSTIPESNFNSGGLVLTNGTASSVNQTVCHIREVKYILAATHCDRCQQTAPSYSTAERTAIDLNLEFQVRARRNL